MTRRILRFDHEVERLWGTMTPKQIGEAIGCSSATVCNAARRTAVLIEKRAKAHRWTADEDDVLRQTFPTTRPRELEERLGLTFEQIRTRAKRLGVRSRQALALAGVQHDFFARHAPETAYFAGLIAADGWVTTPKPAVCLALKEADREMVDRFATVAGASREVRVYAGQALAVVCSSQMAADLDDPWSVHPRKTYDLQPPTVDDHQLRIAYAAGHLDDVLAIAGRPLVRVRRVGVERYSVPIYEWRTSDHNAVIVLSAMKGVIGTLGISRKWAALDTARAALAARQTKGAA